MTQLDWMNLLDMYRTFYPKTSENTYFPCGRSEGSNVIICKCNQISVVLKFPADRKIGPEAVVSSTNLVRSCAYKHKYYIF